MNILNSDEQKELLHLAKTSIETYLTKNKVLDILPKNEKLVQKFGAFVSLHKSGGLRGCIGTFSAERPLFLNIIEMAIAAATQDYRFKPVSLSELNQLEIEISVLSPREKVEDIEKIEVGSHGLYITKGFSSGVLLPQVAVEYNWTRDEFLEHTCLKAGLKKDAWKEADTKIEYFLAQVFN